MASPLYSHSPERTPTLPCLDHPMQQPTWSRDNPPDLIPSGSAHHTPILHPPTLPHQPPSSTLEGQGQLSYLLWVPRNGSRANHSLTHATTKPTSVRGSPEYSPSQAGGSPLLTAPGVSFPDFCRQQGWGPLCTILRHQPGSRCQPRLGCPWNI